MFQLKTLFSQVPLSENNTETKGLPGTVVSSLIKEIEALPVPSEYTTSLQSTLNEALTKWQEDNSAPNELVILSNPVEHLSKIIRETLENWQQLDGWEIKLLSWLNRPDNWLQISQEIQKDLKLDTGAGEIREEREERLKKLIVIPSLELCFLRQIDGLDGIEYLRELIFHDTSHFWLIGCNNLALEYLDYVYKITAYFERSVALPLLNGSQIKEQLMPILGNANLQLKWEEESEEEREEKVKSYFERLAELSQGSFAVGAQLWWRSLLPVEEEQKSSDVKIIKLDKAKLPELPDLIAEDRYLIFSLLLHQKMTLQELAISLGDVESSVQFKLQKLLRAGIIKRENQKFSIYPAYYPKLKTYLKNNNFISGV